MTLRPTHDPAPGEALFIDGQFRVVRALGHGGMARVYLCSYLAGCLVAVKCLGRTAPHGTSIEEMDERFERESQILLALRHPAIVAAYAHGYDGANQVRYLVMEYVRGATLAEVRRGLNRPLTSHEAAELLLPIADALAYCHSRKVYHRDVTPRNILVTRDRASTSAKLVDFGAGWQPDDRELTRSVVFGNVDFQPLDRTSPEHRDRTDDEHQASIDIYGLAAVAYFLTGGDGPDGALLGMSDKLGSRPLEAGPDARWSRLLAHGLRRDASRTPSMAVFRDELKSWVDANETTLTEPYVRPYWARASYDAQDLPTQEATPLHTEPRDRTVTDEPLLSMPNLRTPLPPRPLFIVTNPLIIEHPEERRRAWLVLGSLVGAMGLLGAGVFALGLIAAGQALVSVAGTRTPEVPVAFTGEAIAPLRTVVADPAGAVVDAARKELAATGVVFVAVAGQVVQVGDDRLHVPEDLLEMEMNWEGRTLNGMNPDYPWIALSPSHEVEVGPHEIAAQALTWSGWEALGGARPSSGPCAGAADDAPVGCVSLSDVAVVLNAASERMGMEPAMDPVSGAWNGTSNGLRLPTEAEWERAAVAGVLRGDGAEWVMNAEPLPDMPGPGAGTLRGHEVVRHAARGPRHRAFQRPAARAASVGVRLAWSPSAGG